MSDERTEFGDNFVRGEIVELYLTLINKIIKFIKKIIYYLKNYSVGWIFKIFWLNPPTICWTF